MFWAYLSTLALLFVGLLLIMIILLQRGRGGGLAGAFGGLGGQSAFGTRAGDVFTRITVVLAVIWVALAGVSIWALEKGTAGKFQAEVKEETSGTTPVETAPATEPGGTALPGTEEESGAAAPSGSESASEPAASGPKLSAPADSTSETKAAAGSTGSSPSGDKPSPPNQPEK
ncbi:MAG: preprotein translocase subunit SecG [Planctomycetes bacterium]|nr:preprotein translocase subunit SecG [Planctomycetota bacterium]